MTTTECDDKKFGVAVEEIWKDRVHKEKKFASDWPRKWSWIQDEYRLMAQYLDELKKLRPVGKLKVKDDRSCKPLPDTSAHVIGWLVSRPEFELELYGPYIKKYPVLPPPQEEAVS